LVFIRREIPRHLRGAEGAEPLSAAKGLIYYVAPLCGKAGEPPPQTSPPTYGLAASRRLVGNAELNPPSKPEYVL
jgi:hypothetical protein